MLMLPVDMAPYPAVWLQPLHTSALRKLGKRTPPALSFWPQKISVMLTEGLEERDRSGLGEPHLHVELPPIALCVLYKQLQGILVATLRLLAGHLGTDILLNLGMDDVACPQALSKQQGEQHGT